MNKGQKLLDKAKKIYLVETNFYLREVRCFFQSMAAYYKKAKGCKVWDLNNKMYYDFAGMG